MKQAPASALVDVSRTKELPLGEDAQVVLSEARSQALSLGTPVTSTLTFLVLLDHQTNKVAEGDAAGEDVRRFLRKELRLPESKIFHRASEGYMSWLSQEAAKGPAFFTEYLWRSIGIAAGIAKSTGSNGGVVHVRHLVAGLLLLEVPEGAPRPGVPAFLEDMDLAPDLFRRRYADFLKEVAPQDDHRSWQRWLLAGEDRSFVLPQFDAEGLEGPDLINIETDVHAFARLLAARDLNPPLAIGLFGDWGTGKSFFMHKLRRRIEYLAELARAHREDPRRSDPAFHNQIVHVEFNAWHYVESNLWASLVTHIFETLNHHFSRDDKESERWEHLLRKLDHAHLLEVEASKDLEEAKEDLDEARERADQERNHLQTHLREAWAALVGLLPEGDRDALESGLGEAGMEDLKEALLTARHQAAGLDQKLPGTRTVMLRSFADWRSLAMAATLAIVPPLLVISVGELVDQDWLQNGLVPLTQAITLVGGALGWVGSALVRAKRSMDAIHRTRAKIRTDLEATKEGKNLTQAQGRLDSAQKDVEKRRQRLTQLRSELERARPSRRLASFLAERAETKDYRKHLGVAALVRRDFEQLHRLMTRRLEFALRAEGVEQELSTGTIPAALRERIREIDYPPLPDSTRVRRSSGSNTAWILDDAENGRKVRIERHAAEFHCKVDWNLPTIQRIILYIDDLDRCPPERVVEVLQAVHLLLAFPLFVVVVGVDARWMSSALTLQYGRLWRRFPDGASRPGPHDYLEKIFQVPFWMEPLKVDSTRKLLNGLLKDSIESAEVEGQKPATGFGREAGASADAEPEGLRSQGIDTMEMDEEAGSQSRNPDLQDDDEDLRPASLSLTRPELTFMERLAPLLGRTPRAVKRFVNVYRLIRAGKRGAELSQFLAYGDPRKDGFGPLLMVLAIQVGFPNLAPHFFEVLRSAFPELPPWSEVLETPPPDSDADAEADKLRRLLAGNGESEFPMPEHLVRWLPEVARYSFRIQPPSS